MCRWFHQSFHRCPTAARTPSPSGYGTVRRAVRGVGPSRDVSRAPDFAPHSSPAVWKSEARPRSSASRVRRGHDRPLPIPGNFSAIRIAFEPGRRRTVKWDGVRRQAGRRGTGFLSQPPRALVWEQPPCPGRPGRLLVARAGHNPPRRRLGRDRERRRDVPGRTPGLGRGVGTRIPGWDASLPPCFPPPGP